MSLQEELDKLATLKYGWALLGATDPEEFIRQVTAEIVELRRSLRQMEGA